MCRALPIALIALCLPTAALASNFLERQQKAPRAEQALEERGPTVESRFRAAGAAWPPRGIYLRAFKWEGELEVWAAPPRKRGRWVRVWQHDICTDSGELGPKRREGDGQVPEGAYLVDRFNPWSAFHLSLGLNYPNAVDRARAGIEPAGSDIFIHGGCASVGCLPLGDRFMESLYVAAVMTRSQNRSRIPVHIFPCRFSDLECRQELGSHQERSADVIQLWNDLAEMFTAFEHTRRPPKVRAAPNGRYRIVDG